MKNKKPMATITKNQMEQLLKYQAEIKKARPNYAMVDENFGLIRSLLILIGAPENKPFEFSDLPYRLHITNIEY